MCTILQEGMVTQAGEAQVGVAASNETGWKWQVVGSMLSTAQEPGCLAGARQEVAGKYPGGQSILIAAGCKPLKMHVQQAAGAAQEAGRWAACAQDAGCPAFGSRKRRGRNPRKGAIVLMAQPSQHSMTWHSMKSSKAPREGRGDRSASPAVQQALAQLEAGKFQVG